MYTLEDTDLEVQSQLPFSHSYMIFFSPALFLANTEAWYGW